MSLLPGSAGPSDVRAYITDILISKHDAALGVAQQIANQWQLGRPNDLRHAGVNIFREVCGKVGTFLYRTVQEDMQAEWHASTAGFVNFCMLKKHPPALPFEDVLKISQYV